MPPAAGQAIASEDVEPDQPVNAWLYPSQLLTVEVLRRPLDFTQYISASYQHLLDEHGVICSMSRPGNCLDNAVAESFFHTLKTELVYQRRFRTRSEARLAIFDYVESFYNCTRLHSTLDYQSPEEYEKSVA